MIRKMREVTIWPILELKGQGPAIECLKRVKAFFAKNTNASWDEVFKQLKNHYVSPSSMRSAMYKVGYRRPA